MKRYLFLFLAFSLFHAPVFGFESFDECGVFEEVLKRDFDKYQFNEPDNGSTGRLFFKYASSAYSFQGPFLYQRSDNGGVYLDILPEWAYKKYKISPGAEIFSINSIETRLMDDEEIDALVASSEDKKEVLLVSILDEKSILQEFEIEYEDKQQIYIPVELDIEHISSVNSVNSTYKAVYTIVMEWTLYGLESIARDSFKRAIKNDIFNQDELDNELNFVCYYSSEKFESLGLWKPNVYFSNLISQEADSYKDSFAVFVKYIPSSLNELGESQEVNYSVLLLQDNQGVGTFQSYFNYQPFPFDAQDLNFTLQSSDGMPFFGFQSEGLAKSFHSAELYEWKKKSFDTYASYSPNIFGGLNPGITFTISIERNYVYFLTKIYLPIVIILFLAYSTLWVKPREIEARLTVSVVCFLALITYTFIIDRDLPKLAYLTAMDFIILYSYLFAAIPTLESIYVNKLSINENESGELIDRRLRIFFPLAYIAITLFIISFTIINHPSAVEALRFTT